MIILRGALTRSSSMMKKKSSKNKDQHKTAQEEAVDKYGYGDAAPDSDKYGYGNAAPDSDKYGYGEAVPDSDSIHKKKCRTAPSRIALPAPQLSNS